MAKIFTASQIREIDAYTIVHEPIKSIDLMERAAKAILGFLKANFDKKSSFVFLAGPGNNGGDGWALARLLFAEEYRNIRFCLLDSGQLSDDPEINKQRLLKETSIEVQFVNSAQDFPPISETDWIIDCIFGSGLSRPVEGLAKNLIEYINSALKAGVIAVDIPSGLFCGANTGNPIEGIMQCNYTLSFQFPKLSFFFSENERSVGRWKVLPIGLHPEIIEAKPTPFTYCTGVDEIRLLLKPRSRFSHKGTFGHALVIAGSYGMMGAAVIAARAAMHSGVGLVTTHIPRMGYEIIQTAVPESLVSIDESDIMFTGIENPERYTAVAVGPGINTKTNTRRGLLKLIQNCTTPLVLDADALNIISENKAWLDLLPEGTIITPHPKEFDRLFGSHESGYERFMGQIANSQKYKLVIILKGAYTSVSTPDGQVWFNTTGNPGMATGGSGDVLTGMIVSLLAQGYQPAVAAKIAVYVHGLAGDMAMGQHGYHAVSASLISENIGQAFKEIEYDSTLDS